MLTTANDYLADWSQDFDHRAIEQIAHHCEVIADVNEGILRNGLVHPNSAEILNLRHAITSMRHVAEVLRTVLLLPQTRRG